MSSRTAARRDLHLSVIDRVASRARWSKLAMEGFVLTATYVALWLVLEPLAIHPLFAPALGGLSTLGVWSVLRLREGRLDAERKIAPLKDVSDVCQCSELRAWHEDKMTSLGSLTASFAHELEDPLASLCSELELLDLGGNVQQMKESVVVLRQEAGKMTHTLREMVDFSRRRRQHGAEGVVANAIADATRLVRERAHVRNVKLALDIGTNLRDATIRENDLVLLLVSLITQSIEAMPDGGTITISARPHRAGLELCVRDTSDDATRDTIAKEKTMLVMCDEIVREAGGQLEVTTVLGDGTVVRIELPAKISA